MKTKNMLLVLAWTLLTLTSASAEYKSYTNVSDFEKEQWAICETATDGCNKFFMNDWKVGGWTRMACENKKVEWSCIKKKVILLDKYIIKLEKWVEFKEVIEKVSDIEWVEFDSKIFDSKDLKMFTVDFTDESLLKKVEAVKWIDYVERDQMWNLLDATTANKPVPIKETLVWWDKDDIIYGKIIKITNWKDGKQVEIKTKEGKKYTTAVSFSDTVINKEIGLNVWNSIKVYYTDEIKSMWLLIWNKIEIISEKNASVYGKIIKIENWKDGQQITIENNSWVKFTTAVSIHDKVINEEIGLYLGNRIKVYYTEILEMEPSLLIWDKVEIISVWLSDNDENFHKVIKDRLDKKYQDKVNKILKNYLSKIEKYSDSKKLKINNLLIDKLEQKTSDFLNEFPQDTWLPEKANKKYLMFELLWFEVKKLDFVK